MKSQEKDNEQVSWSCTSGNFKVVVKLILAPGLSVNQLYKNQMFEFERIPSSFGIASSHLFLSEKRMEGDREGCKC